MPPLSHPQKRIPLSPLRIFSAKTTPVTNCDDESYTPRFKNRADFSIFSGQNHIERELRQWEGMFPFHRCPLTPHFQNRTDILTLSGQTRVERGNRE